MTLNSISPLHTQQIITQASKTQLTKLIEATATQLQISPNFMNEKPLPGQTHYPQFLIYSLAHYHLKMPVRAIQERFKIPTSETILFGLKRFAEWTKVCNEVKQDIRSIVRS